VKSVWTVRELLAWTTKVFNSRKISSARLDAELLLADAIQCNRIDLYLDPNRPLSLPERDRYRSYVKMRSSRIPVAYILKEKEFWSKKFHIQEGVLIPRPETEKLIETALRFLDPGRTLKLVDLGTGSGCISIILALELESSHIWAVDISERAIKTAKVNIKRYTLEQRVTLIHGSWFEPFFKRHPNQRFDAIISNPPYIPEPCFSDLAPEVTQYEPRIALNGGETGMEPYPLIAAGAVQFLQKGGFLATEIHSPNVDNVVTIFAEAGLQNIQVIQDDTGRDRIVLGFKQ